jgi:uncharacterized membrane protein
VPSGLNPEKTRAEQTGGTPIALDARADGPWRRRLTVGLDSVPPIAGAGGGLQRLGVAARRRGHHVLEFVVQWTHVLLATFWFGTVMFADFVLGPGLQRMSAGGQREFGEQVATKIGRVMEPVAVLVIVLGFIRGTVLGDVKSIADLGTAYGIAWLVSLIVALGLLLWGHFVTGPSGDRMAGASEAEAPALMKAMLRNASIELVGFFVVFTAMIVMHFA